METKFIKFFSEFKLKTEKFWSEVELSTHIWGYQLQQGTKWLSGHTEEEIQLIKDALNLHYQLPSDVDALLGLTKGLSQVQKNLNAVNDLPEFLQEWKLSSDYINQGWLTDKNKMRDRGEIKFLSEEIEEKVFDVIPIFSHRVIVVTDQGYKIYSVYGDDIIIYGDNLEEYLIKEFLK